jgi:hypothetical protein
VRLQGQFEREREMAIDTNRTVEIKAAVGQMALLALGAAAFTAGAVFILANGLAPPGSFKELAVYVGVSFFGFCTVMIVWRMITGRGTVVTIGPDGIRDVRVADNTIPWSAISDIGTWTAHGQKIMVLAVSPEVEAGLGLTRAASWSRGANRALGADGLCVTAQGIKIGYDALLATTTAYAEAGRVGQLGK